MSRPSSAVLIYAGMLLAWTAGGLAMALAPQTFGNVVPDTPQGFLKLRPRAGSKQLAGRVAASLPARAVGLSDRAVLSPSRLRDHSRMGEFKNMTRKLALVCFVLSILGIVLPLFANQASPRPVQTSHTEQLNFAPDGIIRVEGSYRDLRIRGWDQPEVEIKVTKSTLQYPGQEPQDDAAQRLERVRAVTERPSDKELAISVTLPPGGLFSTPAPCGTTVDCQILAPHDSVLDIQQVSGFVLVSNMRSDVRRAVSRGQIVLILPDPAARSIDAEAGTIEGKQALRTCTPVPAVRTSAI